MIGRAMAPARGGLCAAAAAAAVAAVVVAGVGLASCGGASSSPPSTPSSLSGSGTTSSPASTTTTLNPSQKAVLQPRLLVVGDFPAGWSVDSAPDAAATGNTPPCVADLATTKGADDHLSAVFLDSGASTTGAIETVGHFSGVGQAAGSINGMKSGFESCNGRTLSNGSATLTFGIRNISGVPTGERGFVAQMTLTGNNRSTYLDVFYAAQGFNVVFLGWNQSSSDTSAFEQVSAKALAKL
jgi:hypothetical protein